MTKHMHLQRPRFQLPAFSFTKEAGIAQDSQTECRIATEENLRLTSEMPTSGDLKSGDFSFITPPSNYPTPPRKKR